MNKYLSKREKSRVKEMSIRFDSKTMSRILDQEIYESIVPDDIVKYRLTMKFDPRT